MSLEAEIMGCQEKMVIIVSLIMRVAHRCGQNFVLVRNYDIMAWNMGTIHMNLTLYISSQDALHWFKLKRHTSM